MKIALIGGGAWGTTLAQALNDNNHETLIRDINAEFVDKINRFHMHPFFDTTLPFEIRATLSLEEACNFSDIIILCVPTKVMRSVLKDINKIINSPKIFINVSKGIEPQTSCLVSQIVKQEITSQNLKDYVVLSGPSHAEELILRKFTTLVSASTNFATAMLVQKIFSNDTYLRVYTSEDVIGVEAGGAIKNAIAVVSGISTGLGLGENARAALIARGVKEVITVVEILGGKKETAYGLSGIGDLIVTASSLNSRNFQAGLKIGQGEDFEAVLKNSLQTVEGIRTIEAAYKIGKDHCVELPIIDTAYELLFNKLPLDSVVSVLLNRKLKQE